MSAQRKGNSSWLIWLIVLALIGGGAVWGWKAYRETDKPIAFKTVEIDRGTIIQAVTSNGQIVPVKNVQVGSQVSGIITDIYVDFNSKVTNNQVIARIDPSTYQQNITLAEAELQNAQAGLEYAQLNYNRAKELRASELVSASDFDKTVVDLHQAQAVVKTREASLNKAKVDLERTTIYAPDDGVVISRAVDVGQTVAASFNTPTLFQIAHDLRQMRIEAMVSEADVGGVKEGQQVKFLVDAYPNHQFMGKVSQVRFAPITNQNVVNYTAVVDVNNDDLKLRPGMTATATIITSQRDDVLRIPNAALRFKPSDEMLSVKKTNTGSNSAGHGKTPSTSDGQKIAATSSSPGQRPPSGGGDAEERRRRWQSMTPEQREQFRAMRGGAASGRSPAGTDGPVFHTVYVEAKAAGEDQPKLKAVRIKTGISDGNFTEVLDGLKEGEIIVAGIQSGGQANPLMAGGQRSPFGGFGGRRR
jgi:HlyD family secretion protein